MTIHQEAKISRPGGKPAQRPANANPPGAAYLITEILDLQHAEPRALSELAIVCLTAHAWQASFTAYRFEEVANFPWSRFIPRQPGADYEQPVRPQGSERLVEKTLLIRHVLGAFHRIGTIKAFCGKAVAKPVLKLDGYASVGHQMQAGNLRLCSG